MITYDKIQEFRRAEESTTKPQKLPETFFDDVREYLVELEKLTNTDVSIDTVRTALRQLMTCRDKKLLDQARSSAGTGKPIENLTAAEQIVAEKIIAVLRDRPSLFDRAPQTMPQPTNAADVARKAQPRKNVFRVVGDLPEFVGPDMRTYRLVRGEIVNLPKALNDLLLKEGVLEEIEE